MSFLDSILKQESYCDTVTSAIKPESTEFKRITEQTRNLPIIVGADHLIEFSIKTRTRNNYQWFCKLCNTEEILLCDDVLDHCLTYVHIFKYVKKMYPILYGQLINDSTETAVIQENIKSLNRLIIKLNEKDVFPEPNPHVIKVDNETQVSDEIDYFMANEYKEIVLGSTSFFKKLSEKNDHDKKIEKLNKQTFNIQRKPDEAERNFFKHVNAIDEEFNGSRADMQNASNVSDLKQINSQKFPMQISQSIKRNYRETNSDDNEEQATSNLKDLSLEKEMNLDRIIDEIDLILEKNKKITLEIVEYFVKNQNQIEEIIPSYTYNEILSKVNYFLDELTSMTDDSSDVNKMDE